MRTVELVKGIQSSVLGFGCASILGSVDAKKSRRALEVAFEQGINHFDLARSYGYGEAESFVGKILRPNRDKVVLATKFGIIANWKAGLLGPAKSLVRSFKKKKGPVSYADQVKPVKSHFADHFHDRIELSEASMRKSLETSLREMKSDYVDYFFLHEPKSKLVNIEELSNTAAKLKEEGKIRAWGLASMKDQLKLHRDYLNSFDVLQFNNSPLDPDYNEICEERGKTSNIFFSPFRSFSGSISHGAKLQALFTDFPGSVVLCSMFNVEHLKENVGFAEL
ncbi:MAG: aldo/keto reductase [Ginsengibacter sp.]